MRRDLVLLAVDDGYPGVTADHSCVFDGWKELGTIITNVVRIVTSFVVRLMDVKCGANKMTMIEAFCDVMLLMKQPNVESIFLNVV
uniref:Uncharacterized protein n=1 Tax=Strigamia maritima TaxID=126957 RepID=T1JJT8_STRMM